LLLWGILKGVHFPAARSEFLIRDYLKEKYYG